MIKANSTNQSQIISEIIYEHPYAKEHSDFKQEFCRFVLIFSKKNEQRNAESLKRTFKFISK